MNGIYGLLVGFNDLSGIVTTQASVVSPRWMASEIGLRKGHVLFFQIYGLTYSTASKGVCAGELPDTLTGVCNLARVLQDQGVDEAAEKKM